MPVLSTSPAPVDVLRGAVRRFVAEGRDREAAIPLQLIPPRTDGNGLVMDPTMPAALRDLAAYSAGFVLGFHEVLWDPGPTGQTVPGVLDDSLAIMDDGRGDSVTIDMVGGVAGGVYLVSHDPPRLVFQADDLGSWLQTYLDRHLALSPIARSLTGDDGADDALLDAYWRAVDDGRWCAPAGRDRVVGPAGLRYQPADLVEMFGRPLPPDAALVDFRKAAPGDFADLDPFGMPGPYVRAGAEPVFAVLPPRSSRG